MILGNVALCLIVDVSNKIHHYCLFLFYWYSTEAANGRTPGCFVMAWCRTAQGELLCVRAEPETF